MGDGLTLPCPKIIRGQRKLTPEQEAYASQFARERIAAMSSIRGQCLLVLLLCMCSELLSNNPIIFQIYERVYHFPHLLSKCHRSPNESIPPEQRNTHQNITSHED